MTVTSANIYISNWTSDCAIHDCFTAQAFIDDESTTCVKVGVDAGLPQAASWDELGSLIRFSLHYSSNKLAWLEKLADLDDLHNIGFMLEVRALSEDGLEYVEYYQADINNIDLLYFNPDYFTFQVTATRGIKGWDSSAFMFTGV